jgi:hypothetical protein
VKIKAGMPSCENLSFDLDESGITSDLDYHRKRYGLSVIMNLTVAPLITISTPVAVEEAYGWN